ncbi:MAG: hypothetical protein HYU80_04545 [Candidatus Blackburnbacteria bacterium]|nr:hypothetical protein [Candidatus Blackburnbacteria bacterium]
MKRKNPLITQNVKRAFGEGISFKVGSSYHLPEVQSPRWVLFLCFLIVFWLIGIARIIDLQIIRGSYFRALAEGNRIRRIPLKASRGEILDKNGAALARNLPVYKLATFSKGGVVTETQKISREEALKIQASDSEQASRIIVDIEREYPLRMASAHLVGYVNEASADEVGSPACTTTYPLQLGDAIGRMGIEAQYDCILRGINGEELIEVDSRGKIIRKMGRREPVPGNNITLTIDKNIQESAYQALVSAPSLARSSGGKPGWEGGTVAKGALVAQNPANGELQAMVSVPSFDPNKISQNYPSLAKDANLPLFNRAIGGAYHPGSTFKIVTASGALEEGKIDKDFEYKDEGVVTVGKFNYKNWYFTQYGKTEGLINVVRALTRSTDTFFYYIGGELGVNKLSEWAEKFGLGRPSGIDLPGEVSGLVPNPEWKEKIKKEKWFLGNTYHMAIGQGDMTATPVQIVNMTSVIANGGKLCKPHVVQIAQGCKDIGLKKETMELITEGMVGVCSPGGTAFPLFDLEVSVEPPGRVACKTGTAQFKADKTHAWLTSFAPSQNPDIVLTAILEEGGEGSSVAAPVVRKVLEEWLENR